MLLRIVLNLLGHEPALTWPHNHSRHITSGTRRSRPLCRQHFWDPLCHYLNEDELQEVGARIPLPAPPRIQEEGKAGIHASGEIGPAIKGREAVLRNPEHPLRPHRVEIRPPI